MIHNRLGPTFPGGSIVIGYILIIFALYVSIWMPGLSLLSTCFLGTYEVGELGGLAFLKSAAGALIPMLLGGLMVFTQDGIQIDPIRKRLKNYTSVFGIAFGKWEQLKTYPYLIVLRSKQKLVVRGGPMNTMEVSSRDAYKYDLFLASRNHLKRVMVGSYPGKDRAYTYGEGLAGQLGIQLVRYNPGKIHHTRIKDLPQS